MKTVQVHLIIGTTLVLAVRKDISQHCVNQSVYIITASLDGKDNLFTDYLLIILF